MGSGRYTKFGFANTPFVYVLVDSGLVASKSEARRAIEQGGVSLDGKKIKSFDEKAKSEVLKKGKRHFVKIVK